MREIGIGIVGGGYMGKAHSVAMHAVGAVFNTALRPRLEMLCTSSVESARTKAEALGFTRHTADWRVLVDDDRVEAVVIATPQELHLDIAKRAFELGKPVFCEKPLGMSVAQSRQMVAAAEAAGVTNMTGFNYIRTPASQLARKLIADGRIGDITYFRGEHTEDFFSDPDQPATWRNQGRSNGTMGDLAPHMINAALALAGPIDSLCADIKTVHAKRPSDDGPVTVTNDDQAHFMCRFSSGAMGALYFSRIATGRKMGYIYEISGTRGAIRFNQEDQNSLWLYEADEAPETSGFRQILTGPDHPDYLAFCQGPGHGTGYQDQIIIEAKDFLTAIETGKSIWPTFQDGMLVNQVVEAAWLSHEQARWVDISEI